MHCLGLVDISISCALIDKVLFGYSLSYLFYEQVGVALRV